MTTFLKIKHTEDFWFWPRSTIPIPPRSLTTKNPLDITQKISSKTLKGGKKVDYLATLGGEEQQGVSSPFSFLPLVPPGWEVEEAYNLNPQTGTEDKRSKESQFHCS